VVIGMLAALLLVAAAGLPYYRLPLTERVRDPLHAWLRPSGYVGQAAGIIGFLIFLFLWLYPLRKHWRALAWTGALGRWLDVHIATALTLPLLVAIHAAFRFEGVIGLGYLSMLVVCASGIVGKYLHARIPRRRTGVELTREEVASERNALITEIAASTGRAPQEIVWSLNAATGDAAEGILGTFRNLLLGDLLRWRTVQRLKREWAEGTSLGGERLAQLAGLASREIALAQQARMLELTQRAFRLWHVAHRPFAITALVAVTIHVVVVIAMGATWFR
jgi:hypothetical protein